MSRFIPRQIHPERLSTTDEKGNRVYLYPEDVRGFYRKLRTSIYLFLVAIYLILPWTYVKGEQTLFLDIVHRRFVIFGKVFWGHDAPLLIFILLAICFTIALITALWGRVWCGYACPQTVFIDLIYRRIEIWIEGRARERAQSNNLIKKILKWCAFIVVSSIIAHSFIGYFVGTKNLLPIILGGPSENWTLFLLTLLLTGLLAFDYGWFREQFCIIACPYGRFQSVFMDQDSYKVTYDTTRTDCINCFRCVAVCPTGIDIRRGTQMECIGCTQCIDACDEIMSKVHKPLKLIRYESENGLKGEKTKLIRPRTIIYFLALILIATGFTISLKRQDQLFALWIRNSVPFQVVEERVRNQFKLELFYPQKADLTFHLKEPEIKLITPIVPFRLTNHRKSVAIIFFEFPKSILRNGSYKTTMVIQEADKKISEIEVELVGPIN